MDDKEILRRVIQGFELIPAKQGFGHPYVTKSGAATPELAKRITTWINQNFPQSHIIASYEGAYKTINFRKVMAEHLIVKKLVVETIEEARSQSLTRKVRDEIVKLDPQHIRPAQKSNRIFAPDIKTEKLVDDIQKLYTTNVAVIQPGEPGSESSKFPTLRFKVDDKDTVYIVHAKGIIAGAEGEEKQETNIQQQIKDFGHSITLEVVDAEGKKHTFKNIDGFVRISGNKKADFAFTVNQKPTVFVQYKSPAHQQMSGITKFNREEYPEIDTFIKNVANTVKNSPTGRLNKPMSQEITDPKLKVAAVYGDQNDTADGIQLYCVGDLGLEGEGATKQLTAKTIYVYPEIPKGADTPVLGATYRKDRNQYGIPNVRFGVYPASYIKASE